MAGLQLKYFVLKPKGADAYARASRMALQTYADAIRPTNGNLADDLSIWVRDEETKSTEAMANIWNKD